MTEAAERPEPDSLIGETLANRYRVEVRLGEGAMGTVYRAKHVKVGRPFAVKVLHPRLLEDHKVAQRFEREAELAGRLRHANVIGVVDVGETPNGLRYMVMDFAEGEDLATLLDQAPMPAERIIHLTRQLLEGLYHAHEQGLIHRDFKPENVIVETDMHGAEVPRIVDFGIAILREGGDSPDANGRLTTNGLVLGTPHYMAPEQAVADPIDHRIDLFALGIVIYEMLCGKLPFDGTGAEVARANLLLDPPPIAQRVPYLEVDPLLEAFARRLMAKKRDHRPATAKAARELLDLIDKDRPAAAAALGVPIQASSRLPAVTEPQAPQRRHTAEGNDTYPPPVSAAPLRATDLEAPPVSANALRIPASQREVDTALTSPLGYDGDSLPPRRSRRWMFAAVGLVLAGGIAAIALRGGGKDTETAPAPPPEETKVVMQPTAPPAPPPESVVPVVKGTGSDTGSAGPIASVEPIKDPDPPPVKDPDATKKPGAKQIKKPEIKTVQTPEVKAVQTAEVVKTKPPEIKSPPSNASAIAAKYSTVGQKLRALGPEANDLWPRYRRIQIQQVMMSPDKQKEASAILTKLEQDIAALKK